LATSREGKGYQATFPEFVKILSEESAKVSSAGGPVHVDLNEPAVHQLWDAVRRIMNMARERMLPLLKKFEVEEGNGLSPFAKDIATPEQLMDVLTAFFQPQPRDMRGIENGNTATSTPGDEPIDEDSDDEDGVKASPTDECFDQQLSANIIEAFMHDIDGGLESDNEDGDNTAITKTASSLESNDDATAPSKVAKPNHLFI
jgi:hypothetical protein